MQTITVTLTKDDLSTINGWSNYVKYDDGGSAWDDEDERVKLKVYEAFQPFLAPCLAGALDETA